MAAGNYLFFVGPYLDQPYHKLVFRFSMSIEELGFSDGLCPLSDTQMDNFTCGDQEVF